MGMFKPEVPEPLPAPAPVRIPNPDDADMLEARRRKVREEFGRRQGRASTALAPENAGAAYTRTTLG